MSAASMGNEQEPRLIRVDTPEREEHVIREGTTRIGRSLASDICLEDTAVSRFHCYISRAGDEVRVHEGESKNPARVNGEPVNGQRLRSGHTLRVGHCQFVFEGPLPARPAPPARRAAAAPARRPRVPAPRRSAAPVVPIVIVLLLVPAGIWFFVSGLPALLDMRDRKEEAAPAPGEGLREGIERQIADLIRRQEEYRSEVSGESSRKLEQLTMQIAELQAALERERRTAEPAAAPAPARAPPPPTRETPAIIVGPRKGELEATRERKSEGSTSVTVKAPPAPRRRTAREIRDLIEKLLRVVDDYASVTVTAASLEPHLGELTGSAGKEAAQGALEVERHIRELIRDTDASIAANTRAREALLQKAKALEASSPPEPAPKKEGAYSKPAGNQVEGHQRELELRAKAIEIQVRQRESLVQLRRAVLASLRNLSDPPALEHLAAQIGEAADDELCRALLPPLEASAHREAVPALSRKLGAARDPALRQALRQTLATLVGEDLGEKSAPWLAWWARNKPNKKVEKADAQ